MIKKVETSTLILLFILVFYCALTIGTGWDELSEILRGNQRLKYLFSLGSWENYWKDPETKLINFIGNSSYNFITL